MDTVTFRLDGDAAASRARADRAGVPMSAYVNEVLRAALRDEPGLRPQYVPPARTPEAKAQFSAAINKNWNYMWVFRDIFDRPVVWMLAGELVGASDFSVTVQPPGGRKFAIPLDALLAWPMFAGGHEALGAMYEWAAAGAALHPWDTSGIKLGQ